MTGVDYDFADLDEVVLAYAVSVHMVCVHRHALKEMLWERNQEAKS